MAGLASPGRLRPQVFSTSRRFFDPPRACRPCFMPDPLMGLRPPELSSRRLAVRRLRRRSPLDVGPTRIHLDVPLPLAPAKAEASSNPDSRRLSSETEASSGRNSRRPSRQDRSHAEPNGRPTLVRRSVPPGTEAPLGAPKHASSRAVAHSPGPKPHRAERLLHPAGTEAPPSRSSGPCPPGPKPHRAEPRSILGSRSSSG
jgi:hypothetical protein